MTKQQHIYSRTILVQCNLPDLDDQNDDRSFAALRAIESFANDYGEAPSKQNGVHNTDTGRENLIQNTSDLLCDLAHLCDRSGMNLGDLLNRANRHYRAETSFDEVHGKGQQFLFLDGAQ